MKKQTPFSFVGATLFVATFFITTTALAQPGNTGMRFSEYGGSMSTYENPAFGASGKTKWDVHFFNINNIFENDAIKLNWNSLVTDGNIDFGVSNQAGSQQQQVAPTYNASFRNVLEVHGPAVFFNYKQKYAFGINTRSRFFFQLREVNRRLADAVLNDDDFNLSNYGPIVEDFTNLNLQVLTDIGLTGSAEVLNVKKHSLYAGASLRLYKGIAALDFTAQNINIDPDKIISGDSVVQFSTDMQLNAASPDGLDFLGSSNGGLGIGNALGKAAGSGLGGDIGAVYKGELLRRNLRASVSITDIGRINYNKGNLRSASFVANNVTIPIDSFDNFPNDYDSIKQWAANYGVAVDSGRESFSQSLPTRLNLYAEMQVIKGFYVGVSTSANLNTDKSKSSNYSSYTAIIPRWQSRMIDVWMPISYNYFSQNLKAGIGARLAYVYFGTDDIGSVVSGQGKGFNLYFGLRVAGSFKNKKIEKE